MLRDSRPADVQASDPRGRVAVAAAGVLVAVWAACAWLDGGFEPTVWGSAGVITVAAVTLVLARAESRARLRERTRAAMLAAFLAFVAWNFLSIAWAEFPGDAWIGADKALVYLAGFTLIAVIPWTPAALRTALGLFALAFGAIGAALLVVLLVGDSSAHFSDARLATPTGYVNATVAVWMLAFWPAVYLASDRTVDRRLRPLFLGVATLMLDLAVLGQSRAWLVVAPLVAVVAVLLARQRLRTLLGLAIAAGSCLVALEPLLDVYQRADDGMVSADAVERAVSWTVGSCIVAALAGGGWAYVDGQIVLSRRAARAIATVLAVVAVGGAAAGSAAALVAVDSPGGWLSARWADFRCPYCPGDDDRTRFSGSLSSDRYRGWVVAWREFESRPLTGRGSDNFAAAYVRRRTDSLYEPRYPHSTPVRLLSQLGLVGTLLVVVTVGFAIALALRARRGADPATGGAIGAALAVFVYWLAHGSVDWLWEMPAVTAPAFGFLALAASLGPARSQRSSSIGARRRLAIVAAVVAGVAAAAVVVLPSLSFALTERAAATWRKHPNLAYARLADAARLNPVAADPLVVTGAIATARGDRVRAQRAFRDAAEREPRNWFVHFQLGLLAGADGDYLSAARAIRRARMLNPQEPVAALAERIVRRRARVEPSRLNALYGKAVKERLNGLAVFHPYSTFPRIGAGAG